MSSSRSPETATDAHRGVTIWLTGLSGAGKSTISTALAAELELRGKRVEVLDGDIIRENLSKGLGFSKEDRDENIRRIGFVAQLLTRNGAFVLVAAISPYREVRDEVRSRIGDFVEVYVECSIPELTRRDVKGLYAKALSGEIKNFTGVSDPYEAPLHPEVAVSSETQTVGESVADILAALQARGYLSRDSIPAGVHLEHLGDASHTAASDQREEKRVAGILPHGGVLQVRQASAERARELSEEAQHLTSIDLDAWALSDLELMAGGGMSPLNGFMREADMLSVCERMRLSDGMVWSLPIILPVDAATAAGLGVGQRVALHSGGRALAVLTVSETYSYDRARVAAEVYGTSDEAHPGVARVLAQPDHAVAGAVDVISLPKASFAEYRLTPVQTRAVFAEKGWQTVVGFQTRNPVHRAHEYLQKVALEQVDGLLLHPLVGETKGDDIPADVRMRCYQALIEHHYPADRVQLAVFPASMRYAGPREAIFHALVRKNYGCTHFIVGRDHAGVGSYYGTYDAQQIFDEFDPAEIGIELLKFEHSFYCRACGQMATTRTCPHGSDERVILSGTKVREMLRAGDDLPVEFTRPEIAEILREAEQAREQVGAPG
ncbi:MAG: sulfate adenylyltransferase [Chloroflexota bacterium]|jgi:sulfate adenylyltransferase/3'-phosphoadenosine 5'-phosphosulfate synthase|nr:sulfate adenylyltransferase [Chloroflexota bacterium]